MPALDQTCAAHSDGTRRAILARLHEGELALSDIAQPFDMSQTAVSKHVRVLSDAGLVTVHKRGRTRYCALNAGPMKDAAAWLNRRLDVKKNVSISRFVRYWLFGAILILAFRSEERRVWRVGRVRQMRGAYTMSDDKSV